MRADEILDAMRADGLVIALTDGSIKLSGDREVIARWRGTVIAQKDDVVAALASPAKVGAGETAVDVTYRGWQITYPGRPPFESSVVPPQTLVTMREFHPEAVTVTPIIPPTKRTASDAEAREIRALIRALADAEGDWSTTDLDEALNAAMVDVDAALMFFRGKQ